MHPPSSQPVFPLALSRREALRRILVASALAVSLDITSFAVEDIRRIGDDPDLLKKEIPWPRILTESERKLVTVLADLIVPADEFGPAASAVGVTDFIDEWVSAPYDQQQREQKTIRQGLAWLDTAAQQRFGRSFTACADSERTSLLDDIVRDGSDLHKAGISFFRLFRDRVAGAYYSTPEGWAAIGYTGNAPMVEFPGPPPEALQHVGLA